jgi:serine/threonine-protein kinase
MKIERMLPIGEGYEILREISRGPITTVYLGRQIALERQVLIKLLNVQWQNEPDLIERFRREAIICARLKHPNIVNIFNVGTEADNLFLVIEYVEGENLGKFIKEHHPIPFELVLFIAREILAGLAYAHSRGIIHRDIKPGNIMVSREGAVKITDFGLARTEDLPALTAQGGTLGTPAYMSPEQARGAVLDQRSDLFSLGVTFYEMVSNVSPFRGENFAESIQKVLKDFPKPLKQVRNDIPDWFSNLAADLLNKDPQKRQPSAKKILERPEFQNLPAGGEHLAKFLENPAGYNLPEPEPVRLISEKKISFPKLWIGAVLLTGVVVVLVIAIFNRKQVDENAGLTPPASSDTVMTSRSGGDVASNSPTLIDSLPEVNKNNIAQQPAQTIPEKETKKPQNTGLSVQKEPEMQAGTTAVNRAENLPVETLLTAQDSIAASPKEISPGGFFVLCTPWADVFIDGQKIGTTPLAPISLQPGKYLLELKNPHCETYREQISVQSGKVDSIVVTLQLRSGYLRLMVVPWADVYINGQSYGRTPINKPISLPAGKYEVKLINPNFQAWMDSVSITAGETVSRQISLNK